MSRAFGDLQLAESGVIAVPDVRRVSLHECTKAIAMLCSDGVWEYMTAVEAVNVATKARAPAEAAQLIVEEAALRWSLHGEYRDDITSMLVQLVPVPEDSIKPRVEKTRSPKVDSNASPFRRGENGSGEPSNTRGQSSDTSTQEAPPEAATAPESEDPT
jgi:serine/threonine protein phosphatase PrpC